VKEIKIALAGNPNSGKTSLFNALTGLNHKVSNIAGTTVEKKVGYSKINEQLKARVVDLPGTYSLYPKAADESVAYELLINEPIDLVLFIADASNLKRNLLLLTQIADMGLPVVLVMNMLDVAQKRGIIYDIEILSNQLRIPIVAINARNKNGLNELKNKIAKYHPQKNTPYFEVDKHCSSSLIEELQQLTQQKTAYAAVQVALNQAQLKQPNQQLSKVLDNHPFDEEQFKQTEILERYKMIDHAVRAARHEKSSSENKSLTQKIDAILTHKVAGLLIFLLLLFFIFQAIFAWSEYPMLWVEEGFSALGNLASSLLPPGLLNDLLVNGVLAGLAGVIVFLPQIVILFAFITFLEDIGYMARAAFMMDRLMKPFGMNGRSIVPLISGMACAVPSIMATRSIENRKERLITILVTPLMSCSARLPVYTLLIGLLIPNDAKLGVFNLHGVLLMAMYLLGFIAAIASAALFKLFIKTRDVSWFIMELPSYKMPVWRNMFITLFHKSSAFVVGAGKIIIAVSIVLWALASFGPTDAMNSIENKYANVDESDEELMAQKSAEKIEASYAGIFGKFIEPAIQPLGYDWKIGISLITSLAAREVFVGTMSTIYSVGGGDDENSISSIQQKMQQELNAAGEPVYTPATLLSLMVFYAFALQCISTVSVVRAETQSWKWTSIQLAYLTALAYVSAFVVYHLLK
jgi:ferrous iron transport protein B